MALNSSVHEQITDLLQSHRVVLFMKGNRMFPQCGFSATVVKILNEFTPTYQTVNVLTEPALRNGIKEYSNWPTIPQLYIDGEFLGGCDIIQEMYANGELATKLGTAGSSLPVASPTVTITERAALALQAACTSEHDVVRLEISPAFEYDLTIGTHQPGDVRVTSQGMALYFDPDSAKRAQATTIDFVEGNEGGFKITNPQEPPRVRQLSAQDLNTMLQGPAAPLLFDVRTEKERATAKINAARPFDSDAQALIDGLPKDTALVFHCHHGSRSQAAAERYAAQGFMNVYNVQGGIDAWSLTVDPSVSRY